MPPSASRRGRTRKQPEAQDRPEVDSVEESHTPVRKRRKVRSSYIIFAQWKDPRLTVLQKPNPAASNMETTAQKRSAGIHGQGRNRSSDIKVYEEESSFNEDDPDNIIRNLRTASYPVAAASDYDNEVHQINHPEGKQAYAKIAGKSWTFYVEELEIRIGRPPDERQPSTNSSAKASDQSIDKSLVHIDLGLSKLISRLHAEIRYHQTHGYWYVAVNGRNGIRLDGREFKRGTDAPLRSGSIIEIAGTQMIFITPNDPLEIDPEIIAQQKGKQEVEDEDEDLMGPPSLPHRTPNKDSSGKSGMDQGPSSSYQSSDQRGQHQFAGSMPPSAFMQNDGSMDNRPPSSQATKPRTSPTFQRGLMLETADDIDYGQDTAKDLKPPYSYAQLIGMAILSSSEEKLTLNAIYEYIKERYAFYRFSGGGWQNSIRHNLSLNKNFEKVARRTDEPGKGMKWQIVPEHRDEYLKKGLSQAQHGRKSYPRTSSGANSPSKDPTSAGAWPTSDGIEAKELKPNANVFNLKTSPDSTPPMSHYPLAKQAYTPDRGGNILNKIGKDEGSSPIKGLGIGTSPFPFSIKKDQWNGLTEAAAAGSPGGPRIPFGSDIAESLQTPLITKMKPNLAPPSTARLPSQYMALSSPAPFWKFNDFNQSSPAKPMLDGSPAKEAKTEANGHGEFQDVEQGQADNEDAEETPIRSSSPALPDSPTRAVSNARPGSLGRDLHPPRASSSTHFPPPQKPQQPRQPPTKFQAAAPTVQQSGEDSDEDDDGGVGLDLLK